MAKQVYYKQCILQQVQDNESTIRLTTWIPEEGAGIGKTMKLKDPISKKWKEGRWEVITVGDLKRSEEVVKRHLNAVRNYRKHTDV